MALMVAEAAFERPARSGDGLGCRRVEPCEATSPLGRATVTMHAQTHSNSPTRTYVHPSLSPGTSGSAAGGLECRWDRRAGLRRGAQELPAQGRGPHRGRRHRSRRSSPRSPSNGPLGKAGRDLAVEIEATAINRQMGM